MITVNAWKAYEKFIHKYCPRADGEIILCKDCKLYHGHCEHISHPKQPLFAR